MWKGHGRKIKSELRSTKQLVATEVGNEVSIKTKEKEKVIYAKEYKLNNELDHKIYLNQTVTFPVKSFHRNKYILILLELYSNNILSELMRNRTSRKMMILNKN